MITRENYFQLLDHDGEGQVICPFHDDSKLNSTTKFLTDNVGNETMYCYACGKKYTLKQVVEKVTGSSNNFRKYTGHPYSKWVDEHFHPELVEEPSVKNKSGLSSSQKLYIFKQCDEIKDNSHEFFNSIPMDKMVNWDKFKHLFKINKYGNLLIGLPDYLSKTDNLHKIYNYFYYRLPGDKKYVPAISFTESQKVAPYYVLLALFNFVEYNNKTLYITEGVKDCVNANLCGYPSITMGGISRIKSLINNNIFEMLIKAFDKIVVLMDNDEIGYKYVDDIVNMLKSTYKNKEVVNGTDMILKPLGVKDASDALKVSSLDIPEKKEYTIDDFDIDNNDMYNIL